MIKCCIFDLDGTLLNTLTTITHYVNLILTREGLGTITEAECSSFIGHGARTLIRRALAHKGIVDEERGSRMLDEYNAEYNANTLYLTAPYENIPELIDSLRERGIILGVLSNKPNFTTNLIIGKLFPEKFDLVRGGREGIALKPSPDGLIDMMRELKLSPADIMYIGDTGVDIETGKAAGVLKSVGVSWGFRTREEMIMAGADTVVDSPLDILREVDSLA